MWNYRVRVVKIVDGDTIDLEVDLGFQVMKVERVRLAGLDAPEMNTPGGPLAKQWVREWFLGHSDGSVWPFTATTQKGPTRDKYGRWVADIWYGESHLNQEMLDSGHAAVYP